MKRALVYLLFSMGMHSFAQKQTTQPVVIAIPDSVVIARKQFAEATNIADKDTAQALSLLRAAARIFKKENLALEEGKCHMAIGDIFFEYGQYGRSFGNYNTAQDLFYEVSQRDLFYATLGVAKSQYHRGLYRFAAKSFSEVVEYSYKNNDEKLRAAATEYLGEIFFIFQSNTESKSYFTTAFNTLKNLDDEQGCLRIAGKLFTLHYQDKKFDSALWYSNFSVTIAKKLNDRTTARASSLNRIAAMIRLRQFEEARQELDKFSKIQMAEWEMTSRIRYESINGNYYLAMNENEKAKEVYDSALKHASITNTPDLLAIVYSNMADSYADQGDFEKAYAYGLKYQAMMNNFYSNSISYLSKIESLIKEDVFKGKIKYLSSINRIKELELLRDKDSKQNLEVENKLKDSILQQEKLLSKALESENGYKSTQLESQRQLSTTLNYESQLQKEQLKQERNVKALLVAGCALLLFLGLLALYHYRRTKFKNQIIQKQARDLEILVKEIHHRVKNNLQIISSLLDIQSMTVESEQALQAIKGSKNRVQSMAIIHRFLYHENNIRGIALEDYLQNLCENLFTSYNINPNSITLQTNIDKLNLDVDTMIPLGLVINELISNSLKYAFSEEQKGTLQISLKEKENCLHLEVRDNGKGFPNKNIKHRQTFGLQLIGAFAQKLKAEWELYNDNGAVVCMHIRKYKLA